MNWVDVLDVAEGCFQAAIKGRNGERYILANEKCMSIKDTTEIAQKRFSELNIKLPSSVPKSILFLVAGMMEMMSKLSGKQPVLTRKDISMFAGLVQDFDISKAKTELGFNPKDPKIVVENALKYLYENKFNIA